MKALKLKSFFLSLTTLSLLNSCGLAEWRISELYRQKIEGTSKFLYKYNASGGRDSEASGYVILDSTETFRVNRNSDLPFMYLQELPNKNVINGVSNGYDDNSSGENYYKTTPIFTPLKKETIEIQGIKITNDTYQYRGFAERDGGFQSFKFEEFKETRDSLWFYNLNEFEHENHKHVDSLKFKKSNVTISQDKSFNIMTIVIEDLIIDKPSNEIISNVTYHLTPKTKLNSKAFSDYGVFKGVVK